MLSDQMWKKFIVTLITCNSLGLINRFVSLYNGINNWNKHLEHLCEVINLNPYEHTYTKLFH